MKSLFNKVASLKVYNFIEKRLQHMFFPVKFPNQNTKNTFKNIFFSRIPPVTASDNIKKLFHENGMEYVNYF